MLALIEPVVMPEWLRKFNEEREKVGWAPVKMPARGDDHDSLPPQEPPTSKRLKTPSVS